MTEDAWRAFEYEVQMLHETRGRLSRRIADGIVHNALVESSLLHTRILVDALLSRGRETDNVNLRKLLPGPSISRGIRAAVGMLKMSYGSRRRRGSPCWTLNKRLAHLTDVRGDSFNYRQLYAALDPLVLAALREVALVAKRPALSFYAGLQPL
jgi:hypothetical protein